MSDHSVGLKPILMRSSTPSPGEKVLLFLNSMDRDPPTDQRDSELIERDIEEFTPWGHGGPEIDKQLMHNGVKSPSMRSIKSPRPHPSGEMAAHLAELGASQMSYNGMGGNHDTHSNAQEQPSSEHDEEEHVEPNPNDQPGPHYVSYGSSFGNLGPPRDSFFAPLPTSLLTTHNIQRTPAIAANVPLPAGSVFSPKSHSVNFEVVAATDRGQTMSAVSRAPSRTSQRSHAREEGMKSPKEQQISIPFGQNISITVGASGTTIHVPPTPVSRAPTDKTPTERAQTEGLFSPKSVARSNILPAASSVHENRASSARGDPEPTPFSPTGMSGGRSIAPSQGVKSAAPSVGRLENILGLGGGSAYAPSQRGAASQRALSPELSGRNAGAFDTFSLGESPQEGASGHGLAASYYNAPPPESQKGDRTPIASPRIGPAAYASSNRPSSPSKNNPDGDLADLIGFTTTMSPRSQARSKAFSPTRSHTRSQRSWAQPSVKEEERVPSPKPSRPESPDLNDYENELVKSVLNTKTPRTSIAPSVLAAEVADSHFHDMDLCILLHAADDETAHDVVKKAVRKAIKARLKKLELQHDNESIKAYQKAFHDHDPSWHVSHPAFPESPPAWAKSMMEQLKQMEKRVADLVPKIDSLKASEKSARSDSHRRGSSQRGLSASQIADDYQRTPKARQTALDETGTYRDSTYRHPDTEYTTQTRDPTTLPGSLHHHDGSSHGGAQDEFEDDNETEGPGRPAFSNRTPPTQDGDTYSRHRDPLLDDRGESPGQQFLEEELYKLRVRQPSQSAATHRSWEIAREDQDEDHEHGDHALTESGMEPLDMPLDSNGRPISPPLPPIPDRDDEEVGTVDGQQAQPWAPPYNPEQPSLPPWQRIHQRLLNWAIVWPVSELDSALNSTLRGQQVDEVALSIWSTQQYKRYVRNQLTEYPTKKVDRLFVPPNIADAINNAVFHGRHGDACAMLRDLWAPFGLDGLPRLIIVLCKHRNDASHWVAHKFSLPDGTLTTYDTYHEKCLPDGRPLGWWFAIRMAWPTAMYPSPDHLMQKMVRLHRPMQVNINNSVAAAGIWRNLLMSSRAERPLDLERLRDLINTEVNNLRQRKERGKLSITPQRMDWTEIAG